MILKDFIIYKLCWKIYAEMRKRRSWRLRNTWRTDGKGQRVGLGGI